MKKRLLCVALAAALTFLACPSVFAGAAVQKLKLSQTKATLRTGDTLSLRASSSPKSAAAKIKWRSSNRNAATVGATGMVKALRPGKAEITASVGGRKANCAVTVVKKPAAPKGFKATTRGSLTILSWKKTTAAGYEIYVAQAAAGQSPGAYRLLKKLNAGMLRFPVHPAADQDYHFKIRTYQKIGGATVRSDFSPVVSVLGDAPSGSGLPATPSAPSDSPGSGSGAGGSSETPDQPASYGEGDYLVGADLPAGVYALRANSAYAAHFVVYASPGGTPLFSEDFPGYSLVEVRNGESLELRLCRAVPLEQDAGPSPAGGLFSDGIYLVGKHIPAGAHELTPTGAEAAFYEVRSNARRGADGMGISRNFFAAAPVTVSSGQYLIVKRCSFPS